MPKEITHWLLAESVARHIANTSADAEFSQTLQHDKHCRRMLLLGAILHDAPYYTLDSSVDSPSNRKRGEAILLANRLHAASEAESTTKSSTNSFYINDDSYDVLRACLSALSSCAPSETLALRSFLLGMCTHICADCRFHPRIYFVSGDLWQFPNEAWSRHRALESALDLAFCKAYSINPESYSLRNLLRDEYQQLSAFLRLLPPLAPYTEHILRGYAVLAKARTIFNDRGVRIVLDQAEGILPAKLRAYTALRYTKRSFLRKFLNEESDIFIKQPYRHPVTGEDHQHSYQELFDAAQVDSIMLWEQILYACHTNTGLLACGASLEHGLERQSPRAMVYFKNH